MSDLSKVWFITGCSTGFGRLLTSAVLARGERVIATARTLSQLDDLKEAGAVTMRLDVTDSFEVIKKIATEAEAVWGRIDVLVNAAGLVGVGSFEEIGAEGLLAQYQVNVFGLMNVTNAFLPAMRARKDGTVVIFGSRSGWRTMPMASAYSSSKAAVNALGETLALELHPFKIRVLTLIPGGYHTAGATSKPSMNNVSTSHASYTLIPDYAPLRAQMQNHVDHMDGTQPGDPAAFVKVLLDVVNGEGVAKGKAWPERLVMGSDAMKDISDKMESFTKHMEEWKDVIVSTDRIM